MRFKYVTLKLHDQSAQNERKTKNILLDTDNFIRVKKDPTNELKQN